MRKLPDVQPPEMLTHQQFDLIEETREYKLITPLFGGGVERGEVDPLTPIRGSEVRGHLRFWWRATRGGQFGDDRAKMKEREDEIWGKAYKKEKKDVTKNEGEKSEQQESITRPTLQIEVVVSNGGESRRPFNVEQSRNGNLVLRPAGVPEYAAFPLRPPNDDLRQKMPKQIEQDMKNVQHNVQFLLKITYIEEYRDDIQAALWAWETFGGIGARTRRGFGALHLLKIDDKENTNLPPSNRPADVKDWLNKNVQHFVVPGIWPKDVPHLEQTLSYALAYAEANVFLSWNNLIKHFVSFRQFRTKGYSGRSNWPEAEAIREETGRRYYKKLNHPRKFPRAAFGLPILFHFKDANKGDPSDTTLQGANKENERLASPLILRPLLCRNGFVIGLAVILKGSHIPPLVLKEVDKTANARLSRSDLPMLSDLDNGKLKGETDVLQAFLNDLGGK